MPGRSPTLNDLKRTIPPGGLMNPGLRSGVGGLKADNFRNVRGGLGNANFSNVLPRRKK
jgi:hypothetical protein